MVNYLELARRVREPQPHPGPVEDMQSIDPKARRLLAGDWEPKERCGKTIWKRQNDSFYYSQEMAVHFLEGGNSNIECNNGATGRR